jgi:hypothetical protein
MEALLILLAVIVVVFCPTIIAVCRRHRSRLAIGVLNFLTSAGVIVLLIAGPLGILGAMFSLVTIAMIGPVLIIAWFAALVWSCTGNVEPRRQPRSVVVATADPRWSNLRG